MFVLLTFKETAELFLLPSRSRRKPHAGRTAAGPVAALPPHRPKPKFFEPGRLQPIEKARIGRKNPKESNRIQARFPWFGLVWLGLAWSNVTSWPQKDSASHV
jgi:hypothetical protein